ncbi:MAG: metal ABC transporter substrate-binding protein, partial [Lachnospiraceae bacterium]|nr:metal ABC transporter substrate-binding protein [Lachnospiraceae bacterium]
VGVVFPLPDAEAFRHGGQVIVLIQIPHLQGVDGIVIHIANSGVDLHNFQPSAKDIITIGQSDFLIYIGGESDEWVDSAVETAKNDRLECVNIIKELKKRSVTLQDEPDAMEISGSEDTEEEEEGEVYDEHVWLSLENAKVMTKILADKIIESHKIKGTEKEGIVLKNASSYIDKLQALNEKFKKLFDTDGEKVMVVADRFPFVYFCKDYGIKYFAACKGCASQTEASFQTIKFLTDKVNEYNLKYIFKIEKSDTKIAETIIENSKNKNQEILTLNSIQQVNKDEINKGASYLSLMSENYDVLTRFVKK